MPREERTLTERELNRALLARQLLLERARTTLPRALERMGGLQAQYAPSMYIGLWSRVEGFERAQLTTALERRSVVQATLMRTTIHLVSRRDYWPFEIAVRDARREWLLRATGRRVTAEAMEDLAGLVRRRLARGPATRAELEAIAGRELIGVGLWVPMVRVPPSGTWDRRRADLFGAAESWVGPAPGTPIREALGHLARRYLAAFGPASPRDVAAFTGVPPRETASVLDGLPLRRFRDEEGRVLLDVPRAPLPPAGTPAPVRFLPTWDATLLAHARRSGILPEQHRPLVFNTKTPQSVPTFLVDGRVAGTWRHAGGRIELTPFEPLPRRARRELEEEAKGLAGLHG